MSFIEASQFRDIGVDRAFHGFTAKGQQPHNGKIVLTPALEPTAEPDRAPSPRTACAPTAKNRYALLQQLHKAQPHSVLGQKAQTLLWERRLFKHANLSPRIRKRQDAKIDRVLNLAAAKQPALRPRQAPQRAPRHARNYSFLKQLISAPPRPAPAAAKVISLEELPVARPIAKTLAPKAVALLKPAMAMALSLG